MIILMKALQMLIFKAFGLQIMGGRKKINIHLFEKCIIFYYYYGTYCV